MPTRSHARTAALRALPLAALVGAPLAGAPLAAQEEGAGGPRPPGFTLEQVRSYPYPSELAAAAQGARLAWAANERGLRNLWAAEGPAFAARQLTDYRADDGQELTSVQLSPDGRYVVYVRGGDHGSNWDDGVVVNPTSRPDPGAVQLWSVPFAGGAPRLLGEGDEPAVSPRGDRVAFVRKGELWTVAVDGATPARRLAAPRGTSGSPRWSPDGSRLAFVSQRGDHAFIGVFAGDSASIVWLAPSTSRDASPRWSPDGRRVAFTRRPGAGGAPDSILAQRPAPWEIWTADAASGAGERVWASGSALRASLPSTDGGANLDWAAGGRIVFLSYADGWPHLYSVPERGGTPLLLTPGRYMAEHVRLTPDGRSLVFAANAGSGADDVARRHVVRVPVDRAAPVVVTEGAGLEWSPLVTGDGRTLVYLAATAQRPPLPTVAPAACARVAAPGVPDECRAPRAVGAERLPRDFPTAQLVAPKRVTFRAPDGVVVDAQLFERPGGPARKPAVVYVHGGPPRQMLLGWHYSDYYANAYAVNQYLAAKGYVVLSVNYRLGIGFGWDFHRPPHAGAQGAAEYQDVRAAGEYVRRLPQVDPARVGIYGGSYGGFLTAMALARNSDLFAAGVDIHGVHDWTTERARGILDRDRYEQAPDLERALAVAWQSSPVSAMAGWRSPVLLIHGDDDRNVRFAQTVDLAQRLAAQRVPFEELVIPDDTHHFMRHANWLKVDAAAAAFFDRKLAEGRTARR